MVGDGAGLGISLIVLTIAGDQFIIALARVASALRIRPTVVGAVLGGLGTSFPELVVSGIASIRGSSQLAVGNLVGSIVANVCLALAVAALISPLRTDSRTVRREAAISVAGVLLFAVALPGGISVGKGVALFAALGVAVAALFRNVRGADARDELGIEVRQFFGAHGSNLRGETGRAVVALVLMLGGAELLVRSATGLAARLALAQEFVGLTVVAIGTSAPLIAISVQAARRKDHDLVVGAVLGGNLFIALGGGAIVGLLGRTATSAVGVRPIVLMSLVVVAAWAFMARGNQLNRWEATALVLAYAATLPFAPR